MSSRGPKQAAHPTKADDAFEPNLTSRQSAVAMLSVIMALTKGSNDDRV